MESPSPTLILTPRHTGDSQLLWRAALRRGWHVERLQTWRIPAQLREVAEPVLYVEALFGPMLAEELGVQLREPPDDWLVRLPAEYRLRDIRLTTLGEARASSIPMFVKPPADKSFAARVYTGAELPDGLPDDMPVLVSEVVAWESEFRCFVLDRELRTFSLYARHGQLQDDEEYASTVDEDAALTDFVSRLLADPRVELPRAIGVDVGVIAGRGWACVEANGVWGAGIYACDPGEALEVIRHATVRGGG
ncbi:MAG TPA: ATP-grasp domain-containing protein [Longimicrobium sp.]|nr:ATP-grasp domain-containing protein [Longimicrobium sp.]